LTFAAKRRFLPGFTPRRARSGKAKNSFKRAREKKIRRLSPNSRICFEVENAVDGAQMRKDRQDNGLAAISGPRRVGAETERGAPVGQSEAPQAQISLQFDDMLAAGLVPLRIIESMRKFVAPDAAEGSW
jgi:hypothetical protein